MAALNFAILFRSLSLSLVTLQSFRPRFVAAAEPMSLRLLRYLTFLEIETHAQLIISGLAAASLGNSAIVCSWGPLSSFARKPAYYYVH